MNKSVVVIGGAGFLGKHVLTKLVGEGYSKVICADVIDPNIKDVIFQKTDVLDPLSLSHIKYADFIINCTGQVTFPIEMCLRLNSQGLLNIINNVSGKNHMIQLSTVGVYGEVVVADETTSLNPQTPYSTAKAMAECLLTKECKAPYTILRLSNLYGPGQPKGLMAYLKRSLNSDKKLEFNHSGEMVRSFLHVENCASTISNLIKKLTTATEVYNIAGEKTISIPDLIKMIEKIKGVSYSINWGDKPSWENISEIKTDKIKNLLSINQNYSLEEYIRSEF